MFAVLLNGDELLLGWILVAPPQRLWAKKNWGESRRKEREKIREEKEASARYHTQDSRNPGVNFSNFNLHANDYYDQNHLIPRS